MGNSHQNLLFRNHWANCNHTSVEWSLDGPLPKFVRWSRLPTKMAAKLKIERRGWGFKQNLLLWNYWANLNQTLLKWSLGGPLPKLCPAFQTSDQDGRHSAVALLLKAALIQVNDYRLLEASGCISTSVVVPVILRQGTFWLISHGK